MKIRYAAGLALLLGAVLGATITSGLRAQGKARAYAVIVVDEVTNGEAFKEVGPKSAAATAAAGGHYLVRTDTVIATEGPAPKRLVVIRFDSMDKLQAWNASAAQTEVNSIRLKNAKSRQLFVEGM